MKVAEALEKVGNSHRYQYFTLVFLCLVWFQIVYTMLGPSYIYMNPTFKCDSTGDRILEEEEACPMIATCRLVDTYSITAEVGLYCAKQVQRDLVQSIMYVGSILGLIIMNLVSDRYGRKFAFVIGLGFCIAGWSSVTVGALTKLVPFLVIGQILCGFGVYPCYIISYILFSDLFSDRLRQVGIIAANAAWAVGEMSFYLLYNYLREWQYFVIGFVLIPLIAWIAVASFLLVESPVYLNQYSRDKCAESLNKIAAWNNRPTISATQIETNPKLNEEVSPLEVFKHWVYLKPMLFIGAYAVTIAIYYYGTQFSMENIGKNFGFNMLIVGCLEFVAYFSSTFFIDKVRRKRVMIIMTLLASATSILFIIPAVNASQTMQSILVPTGRFFATYCLALYGLFISQSFPDRVKSSGSGAIEALSNIGNIITPFIVSLTDNAGLNSVFVAGVIFGVGSLMLLPTTETYHHLATEENLRESLISRDESSSIDTSDAINLEKAEKTTAGTD